MGTQNSQSSFKNNSSMLGSTKNYQASGYMIFHSDSYLLIIQKINKPIKI